MSLTDYNYQIAAAGTAAQLHGLVVQAGTDAELTAAELARVRQAVASRFAQINAAALGEARPRWRTA